MKNVLLLGDSIRINYQEYVKQNMEGIANVYYPNDNGKFCQLTLRYLHEWIDALSKHGQISFDVVHFNCGLWDILRLSNEKEPFTDIEQYAVLLERIVNRIKFLCPNTTIIFALTTKVIEPGFEPGIAIGERKNEDIKRYNEVAIKTLSRRGIIIDDLWSVTEKMPLETHSDMVHFETMLGIKMLGDQVVSCIKKVCSEECND